MKKRNLGAFTLIELLTVIAIIGILAAILIPVVGSVRERARATQCLSNIRETGMGLQVWINEHDGVMTTRLYGAFTGVYPVWPVELRNAGIIPADWSTLQCAEIDNAVDDSRYEIGNDIYGWRSAYGMIMTPEAIAEYGSRNNIFGGGSFVRFNFNTVETPSRVVLLGETVMGAGREDGSPYFRLDSLDSNSEASIHLRHNGRAHLAFLDGHVEAAGPERLGELGFRSGHLHDYREVISFPQR